MATEYCSQTTEITQMGGKEASQSVLPPQRQVTMQHSVLQFCEEDLPSSL